MSSQPWKDPCTDPIATPGTRPSTDPGAPSSTPISPAAEAASSVEPVNQSPGELISSVLPYGFLQCTCEKYPKITYINQALSDYLLLSKEPDRWQQNARENIYFLLPFEEREHFRQYLAKALESAKPVQVDHQMFRSDGSRIHLCGWLSLVPGASGAQEYGLLYRPIEDEPEEAAVQDTSYFPVLQRAYNVIFNLNLETSMVSCIHGLEISPVGSLFGVEMTIESAKSFWINNYIVPEDRIMMRSYLNQVCDPKDDWNGRSALQAEFCINTAGQTRYRFMGVSVHLNTNQVLFCCRDITHLTYAGTKTEDSLMLHRIYDWTEFLSGTRDGALGMLLLERSPDGDSLLYASPRICRYLGFDVENADRYFSDLSLEECLDSAELTQADFEQLVNTSHLSLQNKNDPQSPLLQLSCSSYLQNGRTLHIIWVYDNGQSQIPPKPVEKSIFARTFGHFDLFLNGTPITFSSSKEKELMALLIDRNGGTLSTTEAISYLWEDDAPDERLAARYRKLAMGLKRTLEKYGIGEILINQNGVRSVDVTAIQCDYYEFLAGNAKYRQAFHNVYMSDYSWGESTLASLWEESDAI